MGDLVAAHPRGKGLVSGEDEGHGRVGVHWTTVPQVRLPPGVIHRPMSRHQDLCSVQAARGRRSRPNNRPEL